MELAKILTLEIEDKSFFMKLWTKNTQLFIFMKSPKVTFKGILVKKAIMLFH